MDKQALIKDIETFAPPDLAEPWDLSGWLAETDKKEVKRVLLALTVTDEILHQADEYNCDMIISHHPLFIVPIKYKNKDIYCAHTNLDKTKGGTTDELIKTLKLPEGQIVGEFLRIVDLKTPVSDFLKLISNVSSNIRLVNNKNAKDITRIAFCAGSGAEFINEAYANGADAMVTGDVKFHAAVESPIVIFDIGHFESEIPIMKVMENLLAEIVEIRIAEEKSPFLT